MSRDISDSVPDEIASRIMERYGDHASFVDACVVKYSGEKMGYSGVYSILAKNGASRALELLEKISEALECSKEEVADVFRLPLGEPRRAAFQELAGNRSLSDISEKYFGYSSKISDIINGRSGSKHIPNLLAIVDALDLDIACFERDYKCVKSAA